MGTATSNPNPNQVGTASSLADVALPASASHVHPGIARELEPAPHASPADFRANMPSSLPAKERTSEIITSTTSR